jgi:hypothetical protein
MHKQHTITSHFFLFFRFIQALQLATLANEIAQNKDWWWLVQLGKCYHR